MGNQPTTEEQKQTLEEISERDLSTTKNMSIQDGEIASFTVEDLEYGIVHNFKGIPRYASSQNYQFESTDISHLGKKIPEDFDISRQLESSFNQSMDYSCISPQEENILQFLQDSKPLDNPEEPKIVEQIVQVPQINTEVNSLLFDLSIIIDHKPFYLY